MAFVKLDCGILNSTLWVEREPRDVFITALLMAVPFELTEPMPQLKVNAIEETGFVVPPGWYGFIEAAGPGIVRRAIADPVLGMEALSKLGEPDMESRSSEFEGRRLVRVDGGYIVLNFMKYREKDNTSAIRQKRYRDRKKEANLADPASRASRVTQEQSQRDSVDNADALRRHLSCGVTKAEAEAEEEINTPHTPRKGKPSAVGLKAWLEQVKANGEKAIPDDDEVFAYADEVGIPADFLRLAWHEFRGRYAQPGAKRYIRWRDVFRKAVRGNWLKLWWVDAQGVYTLTTAGAQAQRMHRPKDAA